MRVYFMPKDSKWIVKRESSEVLASHYRKEKAIESAKELSLGGNAELIILRKEVLSKTLIPMEIIPSLRRTTHRNIEKMIPKYKNV